MNVADYITNVLLQEKIKYVFGYQGGNITYLIDSISRNKDITYLQTYHEQGAAFAANAYAQVSQKFGVAISSSGPGAINMINGIANAYYDSIPCLFITGNVNSATMRTSSAIRQNGFQETDIVQMVRGITKYAITVLNPESFPEILKDAISIMLEGRKGPVLLDIPHNIQRAEIDCEIYERKEIKKEISDYTYIKEIEQQLMICNKPILWIGGGCRTSKCKNKIEELLKLCPMPVVSSLCGKDVLDNTHYCYRGMIGSYGFSYSNQVVADADFILALGTRFDERQGVQTNKVFLDGKTIVHVDIDDNELGHVVNAQYPIKMSCEDFLEYLLEYTKPSMRWKNWLHQTEQLMLLKQKENEYQLGSKLDYALKNILGKNIINTHIAVDVGIHQMAAAQSIVVGKESNYLNSGGLGAMGYSLPALIGAYYANQDKRLVCICGDGGFMMNMQELQTFAREKIPALIIIINNRELGMISNYQKIAMDGRYYGSQLGYEPPDFEKIAKTFGFKYQKYNLEKDNIDRITDSQLMVEIEVQCNE